MKNAESIVLYLIVMTVLGLRYQCQLVRCSSFMITGAITILWAILWGGIYRDLEIFSDIDPEQVETLLADRGIVLKKIE